LVTAPPRGVDKNTVRAARKKAGGENSPPEPRTANHIRRAAPLIQSGSRQRKIRCLKSGT
jgi:hypothetical protein